MSIISCHTVNVSLDQDTVEFPTPVIWSILFHADRDEGLLKQRAFLNVLVTHVQVLLKHNTSFTCSTSFLSRPLLCGCSLRQQLLSHLCR